MAKKENASFEGEKQRTPVRFKELADAVAALEAHHYIKSYTSPSQLGLSDSDFGATESDLITNIAAINNATSDAFSIYMELNSSSSPNLYASFIAALNAQAGTSIATAQIVVCMRRTNSIYRPIDIDVIVDSASTDGNVYSAAFNHNTSADTLTTFKVSKSQNGFVDKGGDTMTGQQLWLWNGLARILAATGGLQIETYTTEKDTNNRTMLFLRHGVDIDKSVRIIRYTDGAGEGYYVYGEHNKDSIVLGTSIKMTPAGETTRSREIAKLYADSDPANSYGDILVIGAAGDTYIGAGESAQNLYNIIGATASENMYVCSDNIVYLYAACNTIANRKGIALNSTAFYPLANGGHTLGTSSLRWGQIYSTASTISTSDRNEKHDINLVDADIAKRLIMGLVPVTYKFNDGTSGRTHYGLIAQDVEELLKSLEIDSKDFAAFVKSQKETFNEKTGEFTPVCDENGNPVYVYSLRYEEFIAPLIKTVQEQQKMIDRLEERIMKLEERLGGVTDVAGT